MPRRRLLDTLAEAIHERWRRTTRATGQSSAADVPFGELSVELQEANRAAARRIAEVLSVAGLSADEGEASQPEEATVRAHIDAHLDSLAEAEHRQWVLEQVRGGWRYGSVRDDTLKRHDSMVSFAQLSEADRMKTRLQVLEYPNLVRLLGWHLVRTEDAETAGP